MKQTFPLSNATNQIVVFTSFARGVQQDRYSYTDFPRKAKRIREIK